MKTTRNIEPEILILGGGFAGIAAARALHAAARKRLCRVTLIDPRDKTVMLPVLPDYAGERLERHRLEERLDRCLPDTVRFIQTSATAIDLDTRAVHTPNGALPYDFLICATGAVSRPADPGKISAPTYPLASPEEAERIRHDFPAYLETAADPHCLFSGAGYTALELAAVLAATARSRGKSCRFTLVERHDSILPFLNRRQTARVMRFLTRNNFSLLTGDKIIHFDGKTARLASGQCLQNVFICRTEGTVSAINEINGNTERLPDGRVKVNHCLAAPEYPKAYFAGDAAAIEYQGTYLRKAVNFAIYSGRRAGANVARALAGRPPRRFNPVDFGWVIPLIDDSVGRAFQVMPLCGKPGVRLHYLMCGARNFNMDNFVFFAKYAAGMI